GGQSLTVRSETNRIDVRGMAVEDFQFFRRLSLSRPQIKRTGVSAGGRAPAVRGEGHCMNCWPCRVVERAEAAAAADIPEIHVVLSANEGATAIRREGNAIGGTLLR